MSDGDGVHAVMARSSKASRMRGPSCASPRFTSSVLLHLGDATVVICGARATVDWALSSEPSEIASATPGQANCLGVLHARGRPLRRAHRVCVQPGVVQAFSA